MKETIDSVQYFDRTIENTYRLVDELSYLCVCFVLQEGKLAGTHECSFVGSTDESSVKSIMAIVLDNLYEGNSDSFEKFSDYLVVPISGQFKSTIGYVIAKLDEPSDGGYSQVQYLAGHIADSLATSKRSRFHLLFDIAQVKPDSIQEMASLLASNISRCLHCEDTIVWSRRGRYLEAENYDDKDLFIDSSCAGAVVAKETTLIAKDFTDTKDLMRVFGRTPTMSDFINSRGIRSGIFAPISHESTGLMGVVGIFYKRYNGATAVDVELAKYAISLLSIQWYLIQQMNSWQALNNRSAQMLPFLNLAMDVVRDTHDLPMIAHAASAAKMYLEKIWDEDKKRHVIYNYDEGVSQLSTALSGMKDWTKRNKEAIQAISALSEGKTPTSISIAKREYVNISEMVNEVEEFFTKAFEQEKIKFVNGVEADKPRFVYKQALHRALWNLVSNAVKEHSRSTHKKRKIRIYDFEKQNIYYLICEDNGPGISPDAMPRLLEPFFSTWKNVEAPSVGGGLGLGLTIVAQTAELHDGNLILNSDWGNWSRFEMALKGTTN